MRKSNTKQITESLKDLILNDDRAFVAMLSGEWGIGKTYFWEKKFVPDHLKDKKVVYVSLFGQNTLQDIETTIVTKLYKYNKNLKKYTKHLDTIGNLGSKALGLSANISIGSLLSLFTPNDFKNIVICFDDFERLSDKIPLKDVMGLISQFKEQKECKIVMILNEKELYNLSDIDGKKHADIFSLYKEKIVDYNFHYNPSQEELFEAIEQDIEKIKFCDHETIYNFFRKIDLKNIRIMKQALYLLEHFSFIGDKNYDKLVIDEFVEIALNLFVFKAKSNYIYSEFEDFKTYTPIEKEKAVLESFDQSIDEENDLNINEKHERNYKYYYKQNHDLLSKKYFSTNKDLIEKNLYNFIDEFSMNKDNIKALLEENNKNLTLYITRNEISDIHDQLFLDFNSSNKKISEELYSLLEENKRSMPDLFEYETFKGFLKQINDFSKKTNTDTIEKDITKYYIDKYKYSEEGFDFGLNINPLPRILEEFDWAQEYLDELYHNEINTEMTIETIVKIMKKCRKNYHISTIDFIILSNISQDQYIDFIKESKEFIIALVDFVKDFSTSTDFERKITSPIRQALSTLASKSKDYRWKAEYIAKNAKINLMEEKQ